METIAASGRVTSTSYYSDSKLNEIIVNTERIKNYYSPLGGVEKSQVITGYTETLDYAYNSTGLVNQRTVSGYNTGFQYDILGNKTRVTDPFSLYTDYQYDSLRRMQTVTVEGRTFTYEYWPDGMVKAVNYPGGIIRAEYTYDNINRLKTLTNKINGQVNAQYVYTYDNNGNITAVTENAQITSYTYDNLNRLTGITRPNGQTMAYAYDTRGNRTQTTPQDSALDSVTPADFTYDGFDRLSTFTAVGNTSTYRYDPEGLRSKKETVSGATRYHYDNAGRVVAESNSSGQVTAQNIWGQKALTRKVSGSYYYYLYNGHGDVVKVVDGSGNVVNNYSYDEWGNILSKTEGIFNPLKYAGEYYDDESGLIYLRARYYDPTVGRFISRDTVEGQINNPLSLNLYTYVLGNPLKYVDPTGHVSRNIFREEDYPRIQQISQTLAGLAIPDPSSNFDCVMVQLMQSSPPQIMPVTTGIGQTAIVGRKVVSKAAGKIGNAIGSVKGLFSGPKPGTLSNVEARKWYLQQESIINDLINPNSSLEEQAKQAFELRNEIRTQARELMADRKLAEELNASDPNKTWEGIIAEKQVKGLTGDDIWHGIIESSTRSRKSVNEALGLD